MTKIWAIEIFCIIRSTTKNMKQTRELSIHIHGNKANDYLFQPFIRIASIRRDDQSTIHKAKLDAGEK